MQVSTVRGRWVQNWRRPTLRCGRLSKLRGADRGVQYRAHRQRKFRLRSCYGSARLRHDQQVQRRLARQKVLRRQ
ncbi:unnamed protein product, partial [Ascophyllum nodosum]